MRHNFFVAHALRLCAAALVLAALSYSSSPAAPVSDEGDVRSAVEQAFQQWRTGDYDTLYDVLPSASQRRVSRARFVDALKRTRAFYDLDRLEISAVHVAGDLAVVDSVIYARAHQPFDAEGKFVSRQYLVREGGRWRVTTGDRATVGPLLAAHPAFARRYPATPPRIYIKRDGKWTDMSAALKTMRRPRRQ
jgi:hypothetical protein